MPINIFIPILSQLQSGLHMGAGRAQYPPNEHILGLVQFISNPIQFGLIQLTFLPTIVEKCVFWKFSPQPKTTSCIGKQSELALTTYRFLSFYNNLKVKLHLSAKTSEYVVDSKVPIDFYLISDFSCDILSELVRKINIGLDIARIKYIQVCHPKCYKSRGWIWSHWSDWFCQCVTCRTITALSGSSRVA